MKHNTSISTHYLLKPMISTNVQLRHGLIDTLCNQVTIIIDLKISRKASLISSAEHCPKDHNHDSMMGAKTLAHSILMVHLHGYVVQNSRLSFEFLSLLFCFAEIISREGWFLHWRILLSWHHDLIFSTQSTNIVNFSDFSARLLHTQPDYPTVS